MVNDVPYTVSKGHFILMKPGDYHSYYSMSDNLHIFHCNFVKNGLLRYLPKNSELPLVINLDEFFQNQIELFLNLLETESSTDEHNHSQAVIELLDMVLFTINRNFRAIIPPSPMKNVLTYILSDIKNANFSDAVKIFHSSEAHFCRVFKREFSTTFKKYVTKLRIQKAKDLLQNTRTNMVVRH